MNELVDQVLTVSRLSAFNEVQELLFHTATSTVELEGPEEVVGLLKVLANSEDFVDEILNADNVLRAKSLLNETVVSQGNALLVDLTEAALVDEFLDGLQVGVAPSNVGTDHLEHLEGGVVELNENSVVDLTKTQKLHDLANLGGDIVDTTNADNKGELGLGLDVEATRGTGSALGLDNSLLGVLVFGNILLGTLEHTGSASLGVGLLSL